MDVPTHEAAASPEQLLQYHQLLRHEGPQVDLKRAHPDQVCQLGVPDTDLQPDLGRFGVMDLKDIVEILPGKSVQSPLVDCLSEEPGILLGESGSIQAD